MCWKVVAKAHDSSGIELVIYQRTTHLCVKMKMGRIAHGIFSLYTFFFSNTSIFANFYFI